MLGPFWRRTGVFWLLLGLARGAVLPLDDARPRLVSGGSDTGWAGGGGAYLLASGAVRVHARGILTERGVLRNLALLGWGWAGCNVSAFGLCATSFGTVFPASTPRAGATQTLPYGFSSLACARGAGRGLVDQPVYEVSACDVLDEGLDVVYSGQRVYARRNAIPPVAYWILVVGAVVLVRGLGHNVRAHRGLEPWRAQTPVLLASALIVLAVIREGDALYVTESDASLYLATVAYTLAYLAYHLYVELEARRTQSPETQPVFNLAAGAVQLATMRLYANGETPYTPIVLLLIGARTLNKTHSPRKDLTPLLDCMYLSLACRWGFLPDPTYLVAVLAGASLLRQVLF